MSLLSINQKVPLYKESSGMKYTWAYEAWDTANRMIWFIHELKLHEDVQDYKKASNEEKKLITDVFKLFTQNEVMVSNGYDILLRIFKPTEIKMMLRKFADMENTHMAGYSLLIETLGFKDSIYSDFLEIPIMNTKIGYLEKAKDKKYEEYKNFGLTEVQLQQQYKKDIACMLAVYSACTEGISLFAQFAMLLYFQKLGKYKGMCQLVEWSIKDEYLHMVYNAKLYNTFIEENPDLLHTDLEHIILESVKEIVSYEITLIDLFEPVHLDKELLKDYVHYQAYKALELIKIKYDTNIKVNPLPFMDEVLMLTVTDFFSGTVTEYSKKTLQGDWNELL